MTESIAKVRYNGINDKTVHGPSGSRYSFRVTGADAGSQWLPIRSFEDLEAFEQADDYEVKHE